MSNRTKKTNAVFHHGITRRRFLATSSSALIAGGLGASALLSACGGTSSSSGPVEVSYTFPYFSKLPDVQLVADAMNATEQVKQAGIKVRLNAMDFASYEQKLPLGYAGGTRYDVVFTAPWSNNYVQNALKGNFLALDDLLTHKATRLYKIMDEDLWKGAKINGKIYGVPNNNYFNNVYGIFINPQLAEKYKQYVPDSLNSYADIEPFLEQIKTKEPGVTPAYFADGGFVSGGFWMNDGDSVDIDTFVGSPVGVRFSDPSLRVINVYDTPELKQLAQIRWKWGQVGYMKKDPVPHDQGIIDVQNGKYAILLGQYAKPNDIPSIENFFGTKFVLRQLRKPIITTRGIQANMNAIARASAHPEKALQFMELVNTDPIIFNLLCHGIEGKHYVFVDKAKKLIGFPSGVTTTTDRYNPSSDWEFGNEVNGYYTDANSVGIYDHIQEANHKAQRSPAFGFNFDSSAYKTEIAQINAVSGQLIGALNSGRLNPQTDLQSYLDQIKQAGIDRVVSGAQQQLDAWAKSK